MALYPFARTLALKLHALSRYPGNRQTERQTDTQTDYRMPSLVHVHRGIMKWLLYRVTTIPKSQFKIIVGIQMNLLCELYSFVCCYSEPDVVVYDLPKTRMKAYRYNAV